MPLPLQRVTCVSSAPRLAAKRGAASRDETAGLLRRIAVALRMTRARLPLGVALAMAFGLMLLLALGSVLGLAFYAGTANTRQLLADRTNLLLDTLEDKVESLLRPVEAAAADHRGRDRRRRDRTGAFRDTAPDPGRHPVRHAADRGRGVRHAGAAGLSLHPRPRRQTGRGLVQPRRASRSWSNAARAPPSPGARRPGATSCGRR